MKPMKIRNPFMATYEGGGIEEIDNGPSEIIEEFMEFPEEQILQNINGNLIRMDMNIIEYPLFSKNKRRKANQTVIYYFNERKDKYIEVKPIAGTSIPGEFEEKVFISLIKIMRKYGYGKNFVVTNSEILENMCIDNQGTKNALYSQVKEAMLKLTETSYTFKNSLYSNEISGLIENAIVTTIMNIQIISRNNARNSDFTYFKDGRISEIYKVSLSDHFYNNIIRRGYLVYNADTLLNISTSTARGIYLLITKWRFNDLFLKINVLTLLKRIPLKHDSKNIGRSINVIEKACCELREKKLIKSFKIIKGNKLSESEIEFEFDDMHNQLKQINFYEDKNAFNQIFISSTEEKEVLKSEYNDIEITEEIISEIMNILPDKAKELKTMRKTIKISIEEYGYEKVKKAAIYTNKNKAKKIRSYFLQSLKNEWSEDIKIEIEAKSLKKQENLKFEFQEDKEEKDKKNILLNFYSLNIEEQKKIEEIVYKDYINQCGMETIFQKKAFNLGKEAIITNYLKNENYFQNKEDNLKKFKEIKFLTTEELKNEINSQLEFYGQLFDLDEETLFSAKFEIGKILFEKYAKDKITLEELLMVIKNILRKIKNI
ncbi:MAG: hypothetical protein ACRC1R_02405 [Cetobacterium sp.]|uniref:hypothetical protein n=1 Tax=Cetobacterium sp. TaxID=2071632 RepID=UPI003F39663C